MAYCISIVISWTSTRDFDTYRISINDLINAAADVSSSTRGLNLGMCLYLHPFFVYASSEGWDLNGQTLLFSLLADTIK